MNERPHPNFAYLKGNPVMIPFDFARFPDVNCVVTLTGDTYKASDGIRSGDLAMIAFDREPVSGGLVLAELSPDERRLMRYIPGNPAILRSDDPTVPVVSVADPDVHVIGVLVDTMRNPPVPLNQNET